MEKTVLTPEELSKLLSIKSERERLTGDFGILEIEYQTQKQYLLDQLRELNQNQENFGVVLQEKYGEGTVNIDTGEFIKA
jgi:hypothetical protein